jgi:hypothetical protein
MLMPIQIRIGIKMMPILMRTQVWHMMENPKLFYTLSRSFAS